MDWNLLTARPKGMSYAKYREIRKEQNQKVASYKKGIYAWYSCGIKRATVNEDGSKSWEYYIKPQGTYKRRQSA